MNINWGNWGGRVESKVHYKFWKNTQKSAQYLGYFTIFKTRSTLKKIFKNVFWILNYFIPKLPTNNF